MSLKTPIQMIYFSSRQLNWLIIGPNHQSYKLLVIKCCEALPSCFSSFPSQCYISPFYGPVTFPIKTKEHQQQNPKHGNVLELIVPPRNGIFGHKIEKICNLHSLFFGQVKVNMTIFFQSCKFWEFCPFPSLRKIYQVFNVLHFIIS